MIGASLLGSVGMSEFRSELRRLPLGRGSSRSFKVAFLAAHT
jgi:hypothetical protein